MNALAPERGDLQDQRRRFVDPLLRRVEAAGRVCVLRLEALSCATLIADLERLAAETGLDGLLLLAELPGDDASLRARLSAHFTHVATLQQRPVRGSTFAGARHAASRILPLAEPVRAPPACLLHLASNHALPSLAPAFLEADGIAMAPLLQTAPESVPAWPADNLRSNAVGLVERLMAQDERLFGQAGEIGRLRHRLAETSQPHAAVFFDRPRTDHAWPLAEDRDATRGHYDHRPDDDALLEGDAGRAFLERHSLLGPRPNNAAAVAALNAAPRGLLSARPDVSIVIPVHGQLGYTLNCLDSLFHLNGKATAEIIVVDDASADDSAAVLGRVRGVALLRQAANRGFIASCNAGASQARGRFVLFLNNDTRVVHGWLDALVDSFERFPKAGLVGSKMLYPDGVLQEAGGIVWRDGSCWNNGRNDDPNRPEHCYAREVDYVSGCSIMLPTRLFHGLGGFDAHYAPAYCEDADLAMRVRAKGREVWFQPRSRVVHYEGRTSGTDTARGIKAYQVVNGRKFFLRWRKALATHRANGQAPFLERERRVTRRALVVDATTPTPREDAGSVTTALTLQLFRRLGYKPHFVPQDNFLYAPAHAPELMEQGVELAYAPFEPDFETFLRRYGWSFDVILVYRVTVLEAVIDAVRQHAPQAPVLFHNMDLHHLRMERQARLAGDATALEAAAAMKLRELALIGRADCTITHSTHEQALLAEEVPQAPVVVWPFMFPLHGTGAGFAVRRDFVFLGGYRHAPNVDAVMFFAAEILPLIHAHAPDARFIIAGAHPTPEVLALAGPHIVVTGQIDDLRPVFDGACVFACSLRIGAGTKGKVSTAMSYGLPVVTTACGAEGMDLQDGTEVLLADGAEAFAAACLRLYRDGALWERLSQAGQALVGEKHSLAMGGRALESAIETAWRHKLGLGTGQNATTVP